MINVSPSAPTRVIFGRWSPDQAPRYVFTDLELTPCRDAADHSAGRLTAFLGRLDNQAILADTLRPAPRGLPNKNELIEQLWMTRGDELPALLAGDFSLASVDPDNRHLFLARDHHGSGQMFFQQQGDALLFSSSLGVLLDTPGIERRPNRMQVAQLLSATRFGSPEKTLYERIFQVPPGHQLAFNGRQWRLTRYWDPRETSGLPATTNGETNEAFLSILNIAVRDRIAACKRPSIALSGGLDSTTIAAMAAQQCTADKRHIDSYTAIPLSDQPLPDNQIADESSLVRDLCARYPAIRPHWLTSEDSSIIDSMDAALDILREPIFGAANLYWIMDLMRQLRTHGNDGLLTGQCGNATISWTGNRTQHLRTLLHTRGFKAWREEVARFKTAHALSIAGVARKFYLPMLLSDQLVERMKRRLVSQQALAKHTALSPALAKSLGIPERVRADATLPISRHHPKFRDSVLLSGVYSPGGVTATLGAAYGVQCSDPSADKALIEFCYALPDSFYVSAGRNKRLVRDAMANLLPGTILGNRKHGIQAADIVSRVRREKDAFSAALAHLQRSDLAQECLNLKLMSTVFENALVANDPETAASTRQVLVRGLMVGRFLQRFED